MTTIVVCGGRGFDDKGLVYRGLNAVRGELGVTRVAIGACGQDADDPWLTQNLRGADKLAQEWASEFGLICRWYPVHWRQCRGDRRKMSQAARARVARMLAAEQPEMCVGFPGGSGTGMTLRMAQVAGVRVRCYSTIADVERYR